MSGEPGGGLVNETTMSQRGDIRRHLEAHGSITPEEARRLYGCDRLGARIWDLRHKDGMSIRTEPVQYRNQCGRTVKYARYVLEKGEGKV